MRLWTLHPKYFDAKGLVALWREALLAQKVLRGHTTGYRHHPQLNRFAGTTNPPADIAAYLKCVHDEAVRRGHRFDAAKIGHLGRLKRTSETSGQLLYEWHHLHRKLKNRDPKRLEILAKFRKPQAHPLFRTTKGAVRDWEKVQ